MGLDVSQHVFLIDDFYLHYIEAMLLHIVTKTYGD